MPGKLIAVPSLKPGGLESECSAHFGQSDVFTILEIDGGKVAEVRVVDNVEHVQGGCLAPVALLRGLGVDTLLVGGIGMRPLQGFQQMGIEVLGLAIGTVGTALQDYLDDGLTPFDERNVCGHSCH